MDPILEVRGLRTSFFTDGGEIRAVDDVSFAVARGKTLGIVGESGCGKSVTSLSIMRLVPTPPGRIVGGEILYGGRNLLALDPAGMRRIRGNQISMIFQEPMTSLNPVFTVGSQVSEAIALHRGLGKAEARAKAVEMLRLVGIPAPESRVDDYPHQLSGGMRQRVMIAMALSCDPEVLIADEPTTALDVTIQAQILDLLRSLQAKKGLAVLLITHDLGVVAETADDVVVMYAGTVVERGSVTDIFKRPAHPYTRGLLKSVPSASQGGRLEAIPGIVPDLLKLPRGCRFQDRCPLAGEECRGAEPALKPAASGGEGHLVRCVKDGARA
jgi:peptide/nickel transport system ATP-binding protein